MKRILFVDDEPNILEGLERMLFPMQREWEMAFIGSGQEALEIMSRKPFDVIVSDMRMPGMDGAELLIAVMKHYPQMVRFILTGQSDKETILRSMGAAHQVLAKPCNPKALKTCVDRAFALRDVLGSRSVKKLVSQIGALPALPDAYNKLMAELQSPDASVQVIGKIIDADVGMTARILQMVNSVFFGVRKHVSNVEQAVSLLGLDAIKALLLMVGVFPQIKSAKLSETFSSEAFWHHCMAVAACSQKIALCENAGKDIISDAHTAGLLHDSGKLALVVNCPDEYNHAFDYAFVNSVSLAEAERETLGCTHAELGAYLLGIWGLPDPVVEAVAFHHSPSQCPNPSLSALTAVHAANVIDLEEDTETNLTPCAGFDEAYLAGLGLGNRIPSWRDACLSVSATKERKR